MGDNFIFYSNWFDSVRQLENVRQQNELLRAVVEYGVTGEYESSTDGVVNALFMMIRPQIDAAKERYNAKVNGGLTAGRRKTVDDEKIRELANGGLKAKEIAATLGISLDSVYHSSGWRERLVKIK